MTCSARSKPALAAFLAALLVHSAAFGQDGGKPAAAEDPKVVFNEANQAYQLGRFQGAIGKYERVFELTSHPSLLFNLAQCHRQLLNFERAAFFYDRYLSTAKSPIPNEKLARDLLAEMSLKRDEQKLADEKAAAEKLAAEERARQEAAGRRLAQQPPEAKPVTQQWWFWAAIGGAVVVAGTVTAVAAASARPALPQTSLGSIQF
jgi:tetratricopeptide (TPR) repeat protein